MKLTPMFQYTFSLIRSKVTIPKTCHRVNFSCKGFDSNLSPCQCTTHCLTSFSLLCCSSFYRKSILKDEYIYVPPGSNCNEGDIVSVGHLYEDDEEPDRFKWKIVKNSGINGYRVESLYCSWHKNRPDMVLGPKNLKCDEGQPIRLTKWTGNRRQKWVDNSGVDSMREFNVHGTCNQEITLSDDGNLVLKKNTKIPIAGGGVSINSLSSKMLWIVSVSAYLLIYFCLFRFSSN